MNKQQLAAKIWESAKANIAELNINEYGRFDELKATLIATRHMTCPEIGLRKARKL